MQVDDKLAKEKLIGILDTYVWRTSDGFLESELAQLIRNTDLTDCQPQPTYGKAIDQRESYALRDELPKAKSDE